MDSISRPTVSIGMPVRNAERYLQEAFDSLLSQTFDDFEIVISDNGSTDATEAICRDLSNVDSRVRYSRSPENRGAVANFNRVFELANGEFFKWAAFDDLCAPTYLERCVEILQSQPEVVWCHTLTQHIDEHGDVPRHLNKQGELIPEGIHSLLEEIDGIPHVSRESARASDRFLSVLLGTTWCSDSYGLIRSDALHKTRVYLPCYGAEKVLMGELSLLGRFVEIPDVLFFERVHPEASGSLQTAKAQNEFIGTAAATTVASTRWRLLRGHAGSVRRAEISLVEKSRCSRALFQYVFQLRKWRRIASQVLQGAGLGLETRTSYELGQSNAS